MSKFIRLILSVVVGFSPALVNAQQGANHSQETKRALTELQQLYSEIDDLQSQVEAQEAELRSSRSVRKKGVMLTVGGVIGMGLAYAGANTTGRLAMSSGTVITAGLVSVLAIAGGVMTTGYGQYQVHVDAKNVDLVKALLDQKKAEVTKLLSQYSEIDNVLPN